MDKHMLLWTTRDYAIGVVSGEGAGSHHRWCFLWNSKI